MRVFMCIILFAVGAFATAVPVNPVEVPQSHLYEVDVQGHANVGAREARQFGYGGYHDHYHHHDHDHDHHHGHHHHDHFDHHHDHFDHHHDHFDHHHGHHHDHLHGGYPGLGAYGGLSTGLGVFGLGGGFYG